MTNLLRWCDRYMLIRNTSEAKAELSALIEGGSRGEGVIIGKAGVPVAKIVRILVFLDLGSPER